MSAEAHPCGRYVGRIGALAIALGVGAAISTGHGLGLSVAYADEAPSTDASSQSATDNSPKTIANNENSIAASTPDAPRGPFARRIVPRLIVASTGGLNATIDRGRGRAPRPSADAGQTPTPATQLHDLDTNTTGTATTAAVDKQPQTAGRQRPAIRTRIAKPPAAVDVDQITAAVARAVPTLAPVQALTPVTAVSAPTFTTTGVARTASSGVQRTGDTGQQLTTDRAPLDAVAALPGARMDVAARVLAVALAPLLTPGPSAPHDPPVLIGVLAWARREIQRTFCNHAPVAVNDTIATDENKSVVISALANDVDPDRGDKVTVATYTQPASGATVALNPDGTFTYTPKEGFTGTDTFTYTVTDDTSGWHAHGLAGLFCDTGHSSAPATVTVTVNPVNKAPTPRDDVAATDEDTPIDIDVRANDVDPDGDALTVTDVSAPTNGGSAVINGGKITYTPNANSLKADEQKVDTFSYTVSDGKGGTATANVTVTITGVNDIPIANSGAIATDEHTPVIGTIPATDPDGDQLSYVITTPPTNGSAAITDAAGHFRYIPSATGLPAGQTATDSFGYTVTDTHGASANGVITVTVTGVDDPFVAVADTNTTNAGASVSGNVLTNDRAQNPDGPTEALTVTTAGTDLTTTKGGKVTIGANGAYTYTPATSFDGTDTFDYTVSDGAHTSTATVTITVNPVEGPTGTVHIDNDPVDLAVVGSRLYVSNNNNGTVTVIDLLTNRPIDTDPSTTVVDPIQVGNRPYGMLAVGNSVYVANSLDGTVSQIDTTTNKVVATINVGGHPGYLVSSGKYIYVSAYNNATYTSAPSIAVIDTATNAVVAQIPTGDIPFEITAAGDYVYVANANNSKVVIIDSRTNTKVDFDPGPGVNNNLTVAGVDNIVGLAVVGNNLYIMNNANQIAIVNLTTYQQVDTNPGVAGIQPIVVPNGARLTNFVEMAAIGDRLYLTDTNNDRVVVIDTTTDKVVSPSIPVGDAPWGVAVSGNRLYVTNRSDQTVSIIDITQPTDPTTI